MSRGLTLRPLDDDDAAELCAVLTANRAHLARFMPRLSGRTHTVASCRRLIARLSRRIARGEWQLGIFVDGALAGAVSLSSSGELGYWIAGEHEGHGHARAAARALLEATPRATIEIRTAAENLRSQAVARALGFVPVDGLERWVLVRSSTIPHGNPWAPPASSSSRSSGTTASPSPAMPAS